MALVCTSTLFAKGPSAARPVQPKGSAAKSPPVVSKARFKAFTEISSDFEELSKGLPSGDLPNSFCYADRAEEDPDALTVFGRNMDSPVRLASVSKVVTSFWALSVLGPQYRYKTEFSWNPTSKRLHIKGSQDPFMGLHALMFMASELDRMNIHDIAQVSFDSNFFVFELVDVRASYETAFGSQSNPTPQLAQIALSKYFNTRIWPPNVLQFYQGLKEKAKSFNVPMQASPKLAARNIILSEADDVSSESGTIHFTYQSAPLYKYLKHINTRSINYPPSIIFRTLGGAIELNKFLEEKLRIAKGGVLMHTGSGIEYYLDGEVTHQLRVDNISSCRNILKVIIGLEALLRSIKFELPDVLMVAGVDKGTWNGSPEVAGAVTAKTGTLYTFPVSNLAGMANATAGEIYFGIFFQMKDRSEISKAHASANFMVDDIFFKNGSKNLKPLATEAKEFLVFDLKMQ